MVASHHTQDSALQEYVELMSTLFIDQRVHETPEGSDVRKVAQARTIDILLVLDKDRKSRPLKLIHELGLIDKSQPMLSLKDAALGSADLSEISLRNASLRGADLRRVDLKDADLTGTDLSEANLKGANLQGANLHGADLTSADLGAANLTSAILSNVQLSEAKLNDANLHEVDLSRANLSGATGVTLEVLERQAKSLSDATLPNGSKRDGLQTNGSNAQGPDSEPKPTGATGEESSRSLQSLADIAQAITVYLGIPGLLLYPAGFIVLAVQLCFANSLEFSAAWYAASLVSTPIVVGLGAKVLLIPFLVSLMVSTVAAYYSLKYPTFTWSVLRSIFLSRIGVTLLVWVGIIVLTVIFGHPRLLFFELFLLPAVLFGARGGGLIAEEYAHKLQGGPKLRDIINGTWLWRGVAERWIFRGLLAAYAGGVVSAFVATFMLAAFHQNPNLPRIDTRRGDPPTLLLGNSNGYWHVVNTFRNPNDKESNGNVLESIPPKDEAKVKYIEGPIADLNLRDTTLSSAGSEISPSQHSLWTNNERVKLSYTIKAVNNGPNVASDVHIRNELPKDVQFAPGDSDDTCSVDSVSSKKEIDCRLGDLSLQRQPTNLPARIMWPVWNLIRGLSESDTANVSILLEPAKGQNTILNTVTLTSENYDYVGANSKDVRKEVTVKVDREKPEVNTAPSTSNLADWHDSNVKIALHAKDKGGSGVDELVYSATRAKSIREKTYNSKEPPVIDKQGVTKFTYRAKDKAGNTRTPAEPLTIRVDKTDPNVDISSGPSGPTNNNMSTFVFEGSDNLTAKEDLRFLYRIDNRGNWEMSSGASALLGGPTGLADGGYTFALRAVDKAGNFDETPLRRFMVDTVAPTINANATTEDGGNYSSGTWTNEGVDVNISANDPGGSGVKKRTYTVNGDKKPSKQIPTITEEGTTKIAIHAEDNANNPEEDEFIVKLDKTAPKTRATLSPAPNANGWNSGNVTVDFEADDKVEATDNTDVSGVKRIVYTATDDKETRKKTYNPEEPPVIDKQGTTEFTYHAEDKADNAEEAEHLTIKVDMTNPNSTIESGPSSLTDNDKPTFRLGGSDKFPKNSELSFRYRVGNHGDWKKSFGSSVKLGDTEGLEDGKHTLFVKAVDKAGNEDPTPDEQSFTVDTTEPELDPLSDITTEAKSEDGAKVAYDAAATDDVDPKPQVRCSTPSGPVSSGDVFPLGTTAVRCKATDEAGHETTESIDVTIRDTRPPDILGVPSDITNEAKGSNGAQARWIAPTATDAVDGTPSVECSSESGLTSRETFPLGKTKVNCSATDEAGNKAKASFKVTVADTTKPTVTCDSADDTWHKKNVSIPCTVNDNVTDLPNFSLSTHVRSGSETDSAATNRRKVCDAAENCATAGPIRGIKVDKKAPEISITRPSNDTEYKLDEPVTVKYACTDGGSGVKACEGPAKSGSPITTDSGGPHTFKVEATDAAGNTTNKSRTYVVAYRFGHFLRPLKAQPTLNATSAGDSVLVRFDLDGGRGKDIYARHYPHSVKIECDSQDPINFIQRSNRQGTTDHYDYVWDTEGAWSGTCRRLILKLNDGSTHSLTFKFSE